MTFQSGTINYEITSAVRGDILTGTSNAEAVQCYIDGELVTVDTELGLGFTLHVDTLQEGQFVHLLGTDAEDATVDFFAEAFPGLVGAGNHITVTVPTTATMERFSLWRVFRGDAGDVTADEQVSERVVFLSDRTAGGRGVSRGTSRGIDTYGAGRGSCRGLERGFEPVKLAYETIPLSSGTYPTTVTLVDEADNESTQTDDTITLNTYPDPPTDLTVSSFNDGSDILTLAWTASVDLAAL